jgi:hypothetical protein
VRLGGLRDRGAVFVKVEPIAQDSGPACRIIEVIAERYWLSVTHGSAVLVSVLDCSCASATRYENTPLCRAGSGGSVPLLAEQVPDGRLADGAQLIRIVGEPNVLDLHVVAVGLRAGSDESFSYPQSLATSPGFWNGTVCDIFYGT